jgi:DNA-binding response OmpR family regulator
VSAVLRRAGSAAGSGEPGVVTFGDVTVDLLHHAARKGDTPLELSPREFRLLAFFAKHRGEVLTREQLLDGVWGYDTMPFTRTVDTHIAKLRKKVEATPDDPRHILTIHRVGYKFVG